MPSHKVHQQQKKRAVGDRCLDLASPHARVNGVVRVRWTVAHVASRHASSAVVVLVVIHRKMPVTFGAWYYADVGLDVEGPEGLETRAAAAVVQVGMLVAKSHPTYEIQPSPHPWAVDDAKSGVHRAGLSVEARAVGHCGE